MSRAGNDDPVWPPLTDGYFVPLDDVPELLRIGERGDGDESRADLLYVTVPKRGGLRVDFCEIKFRRTLRTARATDVCANAEGQLNASCKRWGQLFGPASSDLERTLRRSSLARILRFYARKARRHHLSQEAFLRISREIERMVREGPEYLIPTFDDRVGGRTAFIFCPEYSGKRPDRVSHSGRADIWLFGPEILPEPRSPDSATAPAAPQAPQSTDIPTTEQPARGLTKTVATAPITDRSKANPSDGLVANGPVTVCLGTGKPGGESVNWSVSIAANPHLMIVGLPGMGKTTCLIQLCRHLFAQNVSPIVFSYHEDIDAKLAISLPGGISTVTYSGLAFNPMEVGGTSPLAYIDSWNVAGHFSAIFPDLGDVQLGRLRDALKRSYVDCGWSTSTRGDTPGFGEFLRILRADPKPDRGLLTRLSVDDYGFFNTGRGASSLLDSIRPALVQVHTSQNEVLQRAFATFVFYNLYQSMFRRGPQQRITHAIIFDEAHRAARLKLIPTMAKECRKYGLSLVLASQEVKDFDPSLFSAVASYLTLRLHETDARLMAKIFAASDKVALFADRIKQMPKYNGWFYGEGLRAPVMVQLEAGTD